MSKDPKDSSDENAEQLTDEQLKDVVGAGKFTQGRKTHPGTVTGKVNNDTLFVGVNNGTLFAGSGDSILKPGIKGADKLKR